MTTRETARRTHRESSRATRCTTCSAVKFLHDEANETHKQQIQILRKRNLLNSNSLKPFCFSSHPSFKPSWGIEPLDGCLDGTFQLRLVSRLEFICEFLVREGVTKVVYIRFEAILCSDTSSCSLILSWKKGVSFMKRCRSHQSYPYISQLPQPCTQSPPKRDDPCH